MAETAFTLRRAGYRVPEDIGLAATSVLDGNAGAGIRQSSEETVILKIDTPFPNISSETIDAQSVWR